MGRVWLLMGQVGPGVVYELLDAVQGIGRACVQPGETREVRAGATYSWSLAYHCIRQLGVVLLVAVSPPGI